MSVLSIKTFDDGLMRAVKSAAALKGVTVQVLVEDIVADAFGVEKVHRDKEAKNPANLNQRGKETNSVTRSKKAKRPAK